LQTGTAGESKVAVGTLLSYTSKTDTTTMTS